MTKITIPPVSGGFDLKTTVDARFQQVEDELNTKVLYRDNPIGEDNVLENDIDLNSNDLLNIDKTYTDRLFLQGKEVALGGDYPVPLVSAQRIFEGISAAVTLITANPDNYTDNVDFRTTSYLTKDECDAIAIAYPDGGGADYVVGTALGTADGYSIIDAGTKQLQLSVNGLVNVKTFGLLGDGSDEFVKILALHDYVEVDGLDTYWPAGVYDCGIQNWPFRNTVLVSPTLKDYKGMTLRCNPGVTFSTTSVDGADILQLNAIKNFHVTGFPTLSGTVSGSAAGTNGVSITNGGDNIHIEANPKSLGYVDQGAYLDGSKGFTIQNGATALNDFTNIKLRGTASDCGYAVEISLPYDEFNIATSPLYAGIDIDVVARDCWRGVSLGAAAATVAIVDTNKDSNINIKASIINCAQPLGMTRWVRGSVDMHIENTKAKAALFKPFAADQSVTGLDIRGDYHSNINIKGTMRECDYKVRFGGISQGGGMTGSSVGTDLIVDLDAEQTNTLDFSIEMFGGNIADNCRVDLASTVTTDETLLTGLLNKTLDNKVTIDDKLTGDFVITMTGGTTSPTGTVKWDLTEDVLTVYLPQILVTSNNNFTTFTGWPVEFRPSQQQRLIVLVQDNGVDKFGNLMIETDGTATMYNGPTLTAGAWTAAGSKGLQFGTHSYRLKS